MKVYCIPLGEAEKVGDGYCAGRFPERFLRSGMFAQKEDRLRSIGAGILLHGILGIEERELRFTPYGKPYLLAPGVHFNISHSGDYVVLAAAHRSIGIDMEKVDETNCKLAPGVYSEDELEWMRENPAVRFTVLWTVKESVLKAVGSGLNVNPRSFSAMPLIFRGAADLFGCRRYCKTVQMGEYVLSLCAEEPVGEIELVLCKAEAESGIREENHLYFKDFIER